MHSASCPPRTKRAQPIEDDAFAAAHIDSQASLRAVWPLSQASRVCRVPARRHSVAPQPRAHTRLHTAEPTRSRNSALRREMHLERIHAARPRSLRSPELRRPWTQAGITQAAALGALPSSAVAIAVAARINAFGPASFAARLGATWRVVQAHTAYAQALGAMWMHRLGSGMLIGSFMVLISGLGTAARVQPVLTLAIVDLLSHIIPPLVSLHGAHLRDDADAVARVGVRTTPSQYARGLLWTGLGDGLIASAMFGLAWQVAYHGLSGPWLLAPLAVLRLTQTCLGSYEFNLFNAFKARLVAPDVNIAGTNQHYTIVSSGIRFVVLSVEANVGSTLLSVATAGVVFGAESLINSPMFHPAALTGIALGGLIAAAPKAVFYPHIKESDAP